MSGMYRIHYDNGQMVITFPKKRLGWYMQQKLSKLGCCSEDQEHRVWKTDRKSLKTTLKKWRRLLLKMVFRPCAIRK